jgi:hypothetical protein
MLEVAVEEGPELVPVAPAVWKILVVTVVVGEL